MTPDQIKPGRTYETSGGLAWHVDSIDGGSVRSSLGRMRSRDPLAAFAAHAVRDITPAPESDQGEKVAEAQSEGASGGDSLAKLTADDWLQIEMAAKGCVGGTSDEWPALVAAINKVRAKPLSHRVAAGWLQGFCEALVSVRGGKQ